MWGEFDLGFRPGGGGDTPPASETAHFLWEAAADLSVNQQWEKTYTHTSWVCVCVCTKVLCAFIRTLCSMSWLQTDGKLQKSGWLLFFLFLPPSPLIPLPQTNEKTTFKKNQSANTDGQRNTGTAELTIIHFDTEVKKNANLQWRYDVWKKQKTKHIQIVFSNPSFLFLLVRSWQRRNVQTFSTATVQKTKQKQKRKKTKYSVWKKLHSLFQQKHLWFSTHTYSQAVSWTNQCHTETWTYIYNVELPLMIEPWP